MRDIGCNEAIPFRPYCGGVVTRMRNISEYMLVLALCVVVVVYAICRYEFDIVGWKSIWPVKN